MAGKVEIFGRDDCRFCAAAVATCQKHRLAFVYRDLVDAATGAELEQRLGKPAATVPQIFIGPHRIGGFEDLKRAIPVIQQILNGE